MISPRPGMLGAMIASLAATAGASAADVASFLNVIGAVPGTSKRPGPRRM